MWVTYKFYDEKSRRLTIVGRIVSDCATQLDNGTIEFENQRLQMHVVTCSKKDHFSKKVVKDFVDKLHEGLSLHGSGFHYEVFETPIIDGKPKKSFILWCQEKYFKKERVTFMFEAYILGRGDSVLPGVTPCGPLEFASAIEGKVPKFKKNGI